RSAFDASDLIVNLSTMNEDLRILEQQQRLRNELGVALSEWRPRLDIGGKLEGVVVNNNPFTGDSVTDIDIASAELDFLAEVSPWAFGFFSINFDSTNLPELFSNSGLRIANSRLFLKRG